MRRRADDGPDVPTILYCSHSLTVYVGLAQACTSDGTVHTIILCDLAHILTLVLTFIVALCGHSSFTVFVSVKVHFVTPIDHAVLADLRR